MGLRNLANTVIEGVRVALNVIDWRHDELEVEDGIENIGTRFTNRTYIMRADVDQRQTDRLSGRFGAWAQLRDFQAVGVEALAPRTDQTSFAAFAYEEVDFRRTRLQFGGRVEQNDYRTAGRMRSRRSRPTTTVTPMVSKYPMRATGSSSARRPRSACTPTSEPAARSSPTSPTRTARRRSRSSTTSVRTSATSPSRWATRLSTPRRHSAST